MGTFITQPYAVDEGQEYADYLDRVLGECRRLMKEGRLPSDDGIAAFLDDAHIVAAQVRRDTVAAKAAGKQTIHSEVSLSKEEHRRFGSLGDSLRNLLEILEMRGALVLNRTEAVGRVAEALRGGEFVA